VAPLHSPPLDWPSANLYQNKEKKENNLDHLLMVVANIHLTYLLVHPLGHHLPHHIWG
jgi:hypothetical protein